MNLAGPSLVAAIGAGQRRETPGQMTPRKRSRGSLNTRSRSARQPSEIAGTAGHSQALRLGYERFERSNAEARYLGGSMFLRRECGLFLSWVLSLR